MDYPKFIVLNQKEEFISIQRVNLLIISQQLFLIWLANILLFISFAFLCMIFFIFIKLEEEIWMPAELDLHCFKKAV